MKAIILAAGKGERLMPLTSDTPKSLLELENGTTLLESQLININKTGITKVVIVTGYLTEKIESKVELFREKYNIDIQIIYNPFYDVSNNLLSLWQAKHEMESDFIIINGDDIFKDSVLLGLLEHENNQMITMVIDRKKKYDQDDMKLIIENGKVLKVSKKIPLNEANGESIGMIRVTGEAKTLMIDTMEKMVRIKKNMQVFYLEMIQELINQGITIGIHEISPKDWAEIDFHPDLEDIRKKISTFNKEWMK
ncbi:MAG: phosphocholine cytidylyltransferase family protein [Candidatus Neomarinimicrobiota bacterium]|nr:phosphocholine cytidylyltransferase family protein [Candidatus Neomarinimicrobiota bacterium]|tara:strand:- start:618 stop:1373 length:756 start_codon:yes stop_codon:yes gene_type:complete